MILVTGATGLIGSHVLLELLLSNKKVRALKRSNSSLEKVKLLFEQKKQTALLNQVEWVEGNVTDITTLEALFQEVKEVYHIAGLVSFDDRKSKELYKVNVKGTANMVNFSITNKVERFLYMSSIAVIDSFHNEVITERNGFLDKKTHSKYAYSKFDAEMEVWRGSQEGLNVVVVNPGVVLGVGFWNQSSGEIIKKALKGYYTSGRSAFVSVDDVAKCSIRLMDENHFNERFIITSENVSYEKLVKTICVSENIRTRQISKAKLKWLRIFSSLCALFGFKEIVSQSTYESLISQTHYDNTKVKKTLNYKFEKVSEIILLMLEKYTSS